MLFYVAACTWVVDKIRAACGCAEKDEDVKSVRDRSCVLSGGQIAEKGKAVLSVHPTTVCVALFCTAYFSVFYADGLPEKSLQGPVVSVSEPAPQKVDRSG